MIVSETRLRALMSSSMPVTSDPLNSPSDGFDFMLPLRPNVNDYFLTDSCRNDHSVQAKGLAALLRLP